MSEARVADALAKGARAGIRLVNVVASCCLWSVDSLGVIETSGGLDLAIKRMKCHSGCLC